MVANVLFMSLGALQAKMDEFSKNMDEFYYLPELLDLCQPSVHLIAHRRYDIINWYHSFLIEQSLCPYLCINFIA